MRKHCFLLHDNNTVVFVRYFNHLPFRFSKYSSLLSKRGGIVRRIASPIARPNSVHHNMSKVLFCLFLDISCFTTLLCIFYYRDMKYCLYRQRRPVLHGGLVKKVQRYDVVWYARWRHCVALYRIDTIRNSYCQATTTKQHCLCQQ